MATTIEWTDRTWNPVTGCAKVSPGCKHCYAETIAKRFWKDRKFTDVRFHEDRLDQPLHWRKPSLVFVNSMSDLFHEDVPDRFICDVFTVIQAAKQHTFQILTKRPERMRDLLLKFHGSRPFAERYPNCWLGVSVEDQQRADERIPLLLQTPAAVRFLSCEPLLSDIKLRGCEHCNWLGEESFPEATSVDTDSDGYYPCSWCGNRDLLCGIDWVIVGGESGHNARPCDISWIRSIRDQCRAAQVPCFVKQLGAHPYNGTRGQEPFCELILDPKGGDPSEWPEDLRVREYPR